MNLKLMDNSCCKPNDVHFDDVKGVRATEL